MKKTLANLSEEETTFLCKKIDTNFTEKILKPRKEKIENFILNILRFKDEYKLIKESEKLEIIEIYFYPTSPLSFLTVNPCHFYYNSKHFINEPSLSLDHYRFEDIENIIIETLDENKIDSSEIMSINFEWDNQFKLEFEFVKSCWLKAKEEVESKIKAFYIASDSSGNPFDLDNGNEVEKIRKNINIEQYLNENGIYPNKDLLN